MTKKADPRIGLILLGWFLLVGAVVFGLLLLLPGHWALDLVGGILAGLLAALIVFGRRAQRAGYRQIEGQPGAAAAALGMLRRGWKLEPAVGFNRNQDVVHRVVGPPGIVLVGEGNPNRLKALLASERRKHERVAADIPIHEVVVGNTEGAVPLPRLVKHVTKLGRKVKPAELTDVLARLRALDATRPNVPMPKGPIPTNLKGARQNMRGR
jgi:membrane protein implicated in regulation of membrane protease activity